MTANINPCNACIDKFKKGYCDINNISNCCYETCSDWFNQQEGLPNDTSIKCKQNCEDCLYPFIKATGRSNYKMVEPPVWYEIFPFFPNLFWNNNKDVNKSKDECYKLCDEKSPYPEGCRNKCDLDAMSVQDINKEKYQYFNNGFGGIGLSVNFYRLLILVLFILIVAIYSSL